MLKIGDSVVVNITIQGGTVIDVHHAEVESISGTDVVLKFPVVNGNARLNVVSTNITHSSSGGYSTIAQVKT